MSQLVVLRNVRSVTMVFVVDYIISGDALEDIRATVVVCVSQLFSTTRQMISFL